MLEMIDRMVERGFFAAEHRNRLIHLTDPAELTGALDCWVPAAAKWTS